jgi:hypothetical protein
VQAKYRAGVVALLYSGGDYRSGKSISRISISTCFNFVCCRTNYDPVRPAASLSCDQYLRGRLAPGKTGPLWTGFVLYIFCNLGTGQPLHIQHIFNDTLLFFHFYSAGLGASSFFVETTKSVARFVINSAETAKPFNRWLSGTLAIYNVCGTSGSEQNRAGIQPGSGQIIGR